MGLLDKFTNPERMVKELVIKFIFIKYKELILTKNISLQNKVLFIKLNPVFKSDLIINKQKLLNFINQQQTKIKIINIK